MHPVSGLKKLLVGALAVLGTFLAVGVSSHVLQREEILPELQVGVPIEAGRWEVKVLRAGIRDDLPGGSPVARREPALVVEAVLANRTGETSYDARDVLVPDPPLSDQPPEAYLMRDRKLLYSLHPGLPERVALAWRLPPGTEMPRSLRLLVQAKRYKKRDNLYGFAGWYDPRPIGFVNLALTTGGTRGGS